VLGIGRHTDYAARIVLHLAGLGEGARVTVREITERRLLPAPFVRRIVAKLAAAGIVRTIRGAGGGIELARPASEVSLLDVVAAIEDGIVLNRCVKDPTECPLSSACPVNAAWVEATGLVEAHLAEVKFSELVSRVGQPRRQPRHPSDVAVGSGGAGSVVR